MVKNLPANAGDKGSIPTAEDSLEEETQCSILGWRIPKIEKLGWLLSMGLQSGTQFEQLSMHAHTAYLKYQTEQFL